MTDTVYSLRSTVALLSLCTALISYKRLRHFALLHLWRISSYETKRGGILTKEGLIVLRTSAQSFPRERVGGSVKVCLPD